MKLDFSSLENALGQLEKSLAYLNSELGQSNPDLREQFRAAAIQAFEYTYELSIKMLRRQLEQIVAYPAGLRQMAFMDVVRSGFEAGLVKQVPLFKVFKEMRNITSHTYDPDKAEEVLAIIDQFVENVRFLLDELKQRNGS